MILPVLTKNDRPANLEEGTPRSGSKVSLINVLLPREIGTAQSTKHNGHRKLPETQEINRELAWLTYGN